METKKLNYEYFQENKPVKQIFCPDFPSFDQIGNHCRFVSFAHLFILFFFMKITESEIVYFPNYSY